MNRDRVRAVLLRIPHFATMTPAHFDQEVEAVMRTAERMGTNITDPQQFLALAPHVLDELRDDARAEMEAGTISRVDWLLIDALLRRVQDLSARAAQGDQEATRELGEIAVGVFEYAQRKGAES